jgi:hypothetical protein
MTKEKLLNNLFQWGVLAAIVAVAMPELAWAQTTLGNALDSVSSNELSSMPKIVSGVAYIGGAVLAVSGAMALKRHAENPTQEKMSVGIARLIAGGGIAMLPVLLQTIESSLHTGSQAAAYTPLSNGGF